MKVKTYAADRGGCGFYRIIWPGQAAKAQGLDVEVFTDEDGALASVGAICVDDEMGVPEVIDVAHPECDVVVLQRPLNRQLVALIPFMQARGVAVVVEVDDDFHSIHPHNVAGRASDPKANPEMNRDWLMLACRMADLVTTTTPALAERYGRHGRYSILPNMLPDHAFDHARPAPSGADVWLGWTGTVATHPDDLQVTDGCLGPILRRYSTGMYVVGDGRKVRETLRLPDSVPWHAEGWVPIDDYHDALSAMDVGIVPLADTDFNRAKSWLKGLEMAASSIPFVASGTPEYQRLGFAGAGLVVHKPRQWEGAVKALLGSKGYRDEVGGQARQAVDHMRYSRTVEQWEAAWTVALANHRLRDHLGEYGITLRTRHPWRRVLLPDGEAELIAPLQ